MTNDLVSLTEAIERVENELQALHRKLATLRDSVRLPSGEVVVLRCRLNGAAVALLAVEIAEVLRMPGLTLLPDSPVWLMGLLTLGSERVPVLDLASRATGARRAPDPEQFIVLTKTRTGPAGLVVDAVEGLFVLDGQRVVRPATELPFGAHVLGVFDAQGESALLISAMAMRLEDYGNEPSS